MLSSRKKSFQCKVCCTLFSNNGDLKCHVQRTHNTHERAHRRPHTGYYAGKSYTCLQNTQLTSHLRTGTGENPFNCIICEAEFTAKSSLTRHLRGHIGRKPFHCNVCEAAFPQKALLTSHLVTHTGEKPFRCNMCEAAFAQKHYLPIHLRTHTGTNHSIAIYVKQLLLRKPT